MLDLKAKGRRGEAISRRHYELHNYRILDQNFTIPGGEIDLIATNDKEVVFVEVKVVDGIDDRNHYLSPRKIEALNRAIETYCSNHDIEKEIRLDVVFIQWGAVIEVYENVSNN